MTRMLEDMKCTQKEETFSFCYLSISCHQHSPSSTSHRSLVPQKSNAYNDSGSKDALNGGKFKCVHGFVLKMKGKDGTGKCM